MSYSYDRAIVRTATVTISDDVFKEIAGLTDSNNHTEANLLGAKTLKATALVKKLELVSKLQDLERSMPHTLGQYRYGLHQQLMEVAKRSLSPEDFERFHGCF
jgi:hypothetical protein